MSNKSRLTERLVEVARNSVSDLDTLKEYLPDLLLGGEKNWAMEQTAEYLVQCHRIKTFRDNEEMIYYNGGFYERNGESLVGEKTQNIWGHHGGNHTVNEIIGHAKRKTYIEREGFEEPPNIICLQNGVFNLNTMSLHPHSAEYKVMSKLNVKYDPDATCPAIDNFLTTSLHEEDIPTFEEIAGYCLYRRYHLHKAFLFIGEGGNGKTVAMNLLKKFLGTKNTTSITIQTLEEDRFVKAQLYRKFANICDDLPSTALRSTGVFKQLTGESAVDTDQKNKGRIEFWNYAKLIFAANTVPEMPDNTDAFFERWIIINFSKKFRGTGKEDVNLLEKITTEEELSGFLNKALAGLKRLIEDGKFTVNISMEETEALITRLTNPIRAFAEDCLVQDYDKYLPKEEVYKGYVEYCKALKIPVKSNSKFTRDLKMYINFDEGRTQKGYDARKLTWTGIYWNFEKIVNTTILSTLIYYFEKVYKININKYIENFSVISVDSKQKPENISSSLHKLEKVIADLCSTSTDKLAAFTDIQQETGLSSEVLVDLLNELKQDGIVFEPRDERFGMVDG